MIYAIIDIGANSIRLTVYKCEVNEIKLILEKKSTAGLIGYIEEGELLQKGIQKACSVLNNFDDILTYLDIKQPHVIATASLGNIINIEEVIRQVQEKTGFRISLLSGEEEAKLGYFGAMQRIDMNSGLYVDIGGGSTELVTFVNRNIIRALSIPYGSLNMSMKYVKGITPHKTNILEMKHELKRGLKKTKLFGLNEQNDICVTGGTARAARKLYNDIYDLPEDNYVMRVDSFSNIITKYNEERRDIIKRMKQLAPDRIHTAIPGFVILQTLAVICQSGLIMVSDYGLREGYLEKIILDDR
jgi:exopolyphosphatase/guanosine-5'-triphosphate,3'-diphosphate pyrophosphatase